MEQPEMMASEGEQTLPPAQYPKGVMVDDDEYLPGVGLVDWAEDFR